MIRTPAPLSSSVRGVSFAVCWCSALVACGGGGGDPAAAPPATSAPAPAPTPAPVPGPAPPPSDSMPAAGHPGGACAVPAAAHAVVTSAPDRVVGTGTPASCSSDAVVAAVAAGGITTFDCGPDPVTITMTKTAKVFNDKPDVVLDGGGKVTLSGGGVLRILYQNTCDPAQVWTSARCDLQDTPRTTVQNLTLVDGNGTAQNYGDASVYGGGAIFVRGGRMKVLDSRFFRNRCEPNAADVGGGALRAFGPSAPVYVVGSTFGGAAGQGGSCSNGGAISGLGASFAVINSVISHNSATGIGGGGGGAVYQDGNGFDLSVCGSSIHDNSANEGGGALFYVSNDRSGTMSIVDSSLQANPSGRFETEGLPGIFVLAAPGQPVVTRSTISK